MIDLKKFATATCLAVVGTFAALPALAFTASDVTSKITDNTLIAVTLIGAFILGVWTLRSMGLLKRG
jgi:hypothetical protein